MLETILTILFALAVAGAIFYFFKQGTKLIVNAVIGLAILFFVNIFSVMSWFGAPNVEISLVSLVICAFGGAPGAVLLIILHLFGITI